MISLLLKLLSFTIFIFAQIAYAAPMAPFEVIKGDEAVKFIGNSGVVIGPVKIAVIANWLEIDNKASVIKQINPKAEIIEIHFEDQGGFASHIKALSAIGYGITSGAKIILTSIDALNALSMSLEAYRQFMDYTKKHNILMVVGAGDNDLNNDSFGFYPTNVWEDNLLSVCSVGFPTLLNQINYIKNSFSQKHQIFNYQQLMRFYQFQQLEVAIADNQPLTDKQKFFIANAIRNGMQIQEGEWIKSYFSNFGIRKVHVCAPGEQVYYFSEAFDSGTEASAAVVAGAASIMLGVNPHLKPFQIRNIFIQTSSKSKKLKFTSRSGGVLNLFEAVKKLLLPLSEQIRSMFE